MVKAKRMGIKCVDVPVVFNKRRRGSSKVSVFTAWGFFWGLLRMWVRLKHGLPHSE
jgi:hypothetical protein